MRGRPAFCCLGALLSCRRPLGWSHPLSESHPLGWSRPPSEPHPFSELHPLGEPHPLGWSHVPSEPHPLGRIRLASLTRSAGRIRLASCARSSGGAACNFGLLFMANFPRVSTLQGDGRSSYPSKLSINDSIRLFPERASVFQGNTASYKVEILKKLAISRAAASIDEQVWQCGLMRW